MDAIAFLFIFIISLLFTFHLNPDNFRRMKKLISLTKELKTANSLVLFAPVMLIWGLHIITTIIILRIMRIIVSI